MPTEESLQAVKRQKTDGNAGGMQATWTCSECSRRFQDVDEFETWRATSTPEDTSPPSSPSSFPSPSLSPFSFPRTYQNNWIDKVILYLLEEGKYGVLVVILSMGVTKEAILRPYKVDEIYNEDEVEIEWKSGEGNSSVINTKEYMINPKQPARKEHCLIIEGEQKGRRGKVKGIDSPSAIVELDSCDPDVLGVFYLHELIALVQVN